MNFLDGLAHIAARLYLLDPLDVQASDDDEPAYRRAGRPSEMRCADGMDFGTAMRAHTALTRRLEAALTGQDDPRLDIERIRRCDTGRLGRWLHGDGYMLYGRLPTYRRLIVSHRNLHLAAGDVLELQREGQLRQARAMLHVGLYARYAEQVRAQLSQFFLDRGGRVSVSSFGCLDELDAAHPALHAPRYPGAHLMA
ncbi:CZB domain-containing protein [Leptothrix discophora]|uniref:CZB domain-containing protein n=1 Tax=Leptothrix discophora TaxID=89 RepID=A0ABT9FXX5_LEPDI|nr:CZB domain-containing protein [Leptothrix discophora]MDP4299078.1 CZB domain-containing protein [Leptothrix discophora]